MGSSYHDPRPVVKAGIRGKDQEFHPMTQRIRGVSLTGNASIPF